MTNHNFKQATPTKVAKKETKFYYNSGKNTK